MRRLASGATGSLIAASALGIVACGGPKPTQSVPDVAPGAATSARPFEPPPPLRVVPFEKSPIDPEASRTLRDHSGDPPVAIDQREPPALTREALEDTARSEARGLTPEGGVHVAELDAGKRAVVPLTVAKGDCLTVIAHGGLGVMEVDAFVVEHDTSPPRVLAEDTKSGPMAVVGGLAGCYPYVGESGATLDVIVQARKGSGPVVFGVYRSKP